MERDEWVIGAVLLMAMLGLSAFNIWFMHDVTERLKINKPTPATSGGSRMARKWEYATVSGLEVDFSDEKALEEYLNIMDESASSSFGRDCQCISPLMASSRRIDPSL